MLSTLIIAGRGKLHLDCWVVNNKFPNWREKNKKNYAELSVRRLKALQAALQTIRKHNQWQVIQSVVPKFL